MEKVINKEDNNTIDSYNYNYGYGYGDGYGNGDGG